MMQVPVVSQLSVCFFNDLNDYVSDKIKKKRKIKQNSLTKVSENSLKFIWCLLSQSNGATYPGGVAQSFGGVGRNLADGLSHLGVNAFFISAIGKDSHRAGFKAYCHHMVTSKYMTTK